MAQEELDVLLTHMSAMAEAVNAFNSEAVQHEAFSVLIAAFEGKHHGAKHQAAAEQEHPAQGETLTPPKPATGTAKSKRASKASR